MLGLTRIARALRDGRDNENEVFQKRQEADEWLKAKVKKYGITDPKFS
jgi:hypothetical protein